VINRLALIGTVSAVALGVLGIAAEPAPAQNQEILRVAMNADPDVLDMTQSTNPPQGLATMMNVYDTLDETDAAGHIVPGLATSWEIENGGKVIVFHLRHGVKFQSGDPFTAADVIWSHERELKKAPFYKGFARYIKTVIAVDPYTVKFVFTQPDAQFLPVHALVIASKAYYDRVGDKEFALHPVGTGPYRIVDYKPAQYLDVAAWKGYWGTKPQIQKAHFIFVQDENTRVAALQSGQVDMIMATPYSSYQQLKALGFTEVKLPVHPTQSVQFSLIDSHVPWADVRIRQAMAYAIDKDAIVKGLLQGIPTDYPRLTPGEVGYDRDLMDYKYDPAKAKRLEAEAGYPNGFDMPLYVSTGVYYGTRQTAEAVALYLKNNLNINCHIHEMQLIQLLQLIGRMAHDPNGRYVAVAGLPVSNLPTPLEGVSLAFYGKNRLSLSHNPKLDALFEKADAILDPTKEAPLIRQIMAIEQQTLPTITLWQYVDVYAMKKGITYTPGIHGLEVVYLPWVHEAVQVGSAK
jgi:peptide/nickel transport system substrate-binding protein